MSDSCIVCGEEIEYPEYTLLCNPCTAAELEYANKGESS